MTLPTGPTTLQNVIPAYLYVEYQDDDNVQAFVTAWNQIAQTYINTMNQLQTISVYTENWIVGPLLDWVLTGIYDIPRPGLPTAGVEALGPYNTYVFNANLPYGGNKPGIPQTFTQTSDDVYKRVATWALFKGDGKQFNMWWLKRRIVRFLTGMNGAAPIIDNTQAVSVVFTSPYSATITLATSPISVIFKAAVIAGVLELPFQIGWTVVLS